MYSSAFFRDMYDVFRMLKYTWTYTHIHYISYTIVSKTIMETFLETCDLNFRHHIYLDNINYNGIIKNNIIY
jgi:hypothetical protein